jgi:hypothetical protein
MKVRVVEVEGTPEELASSAGVLELLRGAGVQAVPDAMEAAKPEATTSNGTSQLPKELRDFITSRAGSGTRADIVQRWIADVMPGGATYRLGKSKTSADGLNNYLMLDNIGVRYYGAFAYVHPAQTRITLRLLRADAEGFKHVTFRNVKEGAGYEVMISLTSDEAYEEALQLARKALERVQAP